MKLSEACPDCGHGYGSSTIGHRQWLRCGRCSHSWQENPVKEVVLGSAAPLWSCITEDSYVYMMNPYGGIFFEFLVDDDDRKVTEKKVTMIVDALNAHETRKTDGQG